MIILQYTCMKEFQKNEMVLFFDLEDEYKLDAPEMEVVIKFRVLNRSHKDYMLTFRMRFSTSIDYLLLHDIIIVPAVV